eukprot:2934246-Amphidinium_carterae.1
MSFSAEPLSSQREADRPKCRIPVFETCSKKQSNLKQTGDWHGTYNHTTVTVLPCVCGCEAKCCSVVGLGRDYQSHTLVSRRLWVSCPQGARGGLEALVWRPDLPGAQAAAKAKSDGSDASWVPAILQPVS